MKIRLTLFLYQSTILKNVIPDISSIISMIQNPLSIIDLTKQYSYVQMHISSSFIRRAIVK